MGKNAIFHSKYGLEIEQAITEFEETTFKTLNRLDAQGGGLTQTSFVR